jgi:hypothetical protein
VQFEAKYRSFVSQMFDDLGCAVPLPANLPYPAVYDELGINTFRWMY